MEINVVAETREIVKAVILAAGKGTRMRGLCEQRPKPLLPLANRPALQLTISRLRDAGVTEMLIVVGHRPEQIKLSHGYGSALGVKLYYVTQQNINGTGGALMLAEDFVENQPFVMAFGDVISHSENYTRAVNVFNAGSEAVLSTYDIGKPVRIGAVFTENNRLTRIVERPGPRERSPLVSAGLFIFPPKIFQTTRDLPPAPSGEHELTGGIQRLAESGVAITTMPITGYWANLTDPDSLLWANEQVQREIAEQHGQLVEGTVRISPQATIDRLAAIADYVRIEAGAVIGRNVSIGQGSTIAGGARLESCIVLEKVSVGADAVIENAIIDAGTVVPAGTVVKSPPECAAIIWKSMYA